MKAIFYQKWRDENKKFLEGKGILLPKDKIILHLCASKYGSDTRDYKDAGYDVRSVMEENDVKSAVWSKEWLGFNGMEPIERKKIYGIIANPPCTEFSIAKTSSVRDLEKGLELVRVCQEIIWKCASQLERPELKGSRTPTLKFWAIENPGSGMLRYFLGKPTFEYSPDEFGADFTKRTALWGHFNTPIIPFILRPKLFKRDITNTISPMTVRDRKDRTDQRSIASPLFTKAFFLANQ